MVTTPSYVEKLLQFSVLLQQQYPRYYSTEVYSRLTTGLDDISVIHFMAHYNDYDYFTSGLFGKGIKVYTNLITGETTLSLAGDGVISNAVYVKRNIPLLYTISTGNPNNTNPNALPEDINKIVINKTDVNKLLIELNKKTLNSSPNYVNSSTAKPWYLSPLNILMMSASGVLLFFIVRN